MQCKERNSWEYKSSSFRRCNGIHWNETWIRQRLKCSLHLPHVQLRCCASSFSHAMCVLVRRCRQILLRVCTRKRYYRSIHPIPIQRACCQKRKTEEKREKRVGTWNTRMIQVINSQILPIVSRPKRIQTCSPAAARSDGSSRMCMILLILRCRPSQLSVSPLHLWWHKQMLFHDNLLSGQRGRVSEIDVNKESLSNDQQQLVLSSHYPSTAIPESFWIS